MKNKLILLTACSLIANSHADECVVKHAPKHEGYIEKVIEGNKILTESIEGKALQAKLVQLRNKYEKELKTMESELEKEANELRSRARTVDQETLEKDQERLMRKKKELDVKAETSNEELQRTAQREQIKFAGKIQEIATETAKAHNWDKITLKETGQIIYVSPRMNGTDEVLRTLDNKTKRDKDQSKKAVPA